MNYFIYKLINAFIKNGQKQGAENIIYNSLKALKNNKLQNKEKVSMKEITKKIELYSNSLVELCYNNSKRNKKKYPFFVAFQRSKRITAKSIKKVIYSVNEKGVKSKIFKEFNACLLNKGLLIKNKRSIYKFTIKSLPALQKGLKKYSSRRKRIKRT
jgi:ribosomal protein S7